MWHWPLRRETVLLPLPLKMNQHALPRAIEPVLKRGERVAVLLFKYEAPLGGGSFIDAGAEPQRDRADEGPEIDPATVHAFTSPYASMRPGRRRPGNEGREIVTQDFVELQ
jgi:hypothetical protein